MPTEQEQAQYRVYCQVMRKVGGLEPRGLKDWLVTYHAMERRRKRKLRLSKSSEKGTL